MTLPASVRRVASPVGDLLIAADADGLRLCEFAEGKYTQTYLDRLGEARSDDAMLDRVRDELAAYFAGTLRTFTVPTPALGTAFQQSVWRQLAAIPYGQTRSYAEQAIAVGNLNAVRAVARANGANFRAVILPCHRVIGSDGALTGFGGGTACKQWLLDHERAVCGETLV